LSGIYIHIPYCKKACYYCDFHFSTQLESIENMVKAMVWEVEQRKNYLTSPTIETIYFGGGTPSLLNTNYLNSLLESIGKHFHLTLKEFTIEVNPDDLTPKKLQDWKSLGIDRLSLGIQSFNDEVLKFYNRAHNSEEAKKAVAISRNAGFEKLSLDLIYGFPSLNHDLWKNDLKQALSYDPGHISSYCLTVEPKTTLGNWSKKGKFNEASEEFAAEQFEWLQEQTEKAGYIQYEISNFGKENQFAIHNTNYWNGVPYLGIGPGAHSFDGQNRGFNPSNNSNYIKKHRLGILSFQKEVLEQSEVVNEYILTSLRTIWGTDVKKINKEYFPNYLQEKQLEIIRLEKEGLLIIKNDHVILTKKGKLLADSVAASIFI